MMKLSVRSAAIVLAAVASATPTFAAYTIQRIGLTGPIYTGSDASNVPIEQNSLVYADASGTVVGYTTQFNGTFSAGTTAMWVYNGTGTTQIGLTSSAYQSSAGGNSVNTSTYGGYANSRVLNNGYIAGTSARYYNASATTSTNIGPDAWLFDGTTTTKISLPSSVPTGTTSSAYSTKLAYSYVDASGNTRQSMGSTVVMAGGNGSAFGTTSLYYTGVSTTAPNSSSTDVWYYANGTTKTIGLMNANNENTTSATAAQPFMRSSTPVRININGLAFGYSNNYAGSTSLAGANGQDLWLYDPTDTTGSGVNGTKLLVAPVSGADVGVNVYTGGNATLSAPQYMNDSGEVAAAFQKFAVGDTPRATALGQDAFIYHNATSTWTQVGLTASVDPVYTFYSAPGAAVATARAGFGGSNFAGTSGYLQQYPAINNNGQAVGYSKRTAASGSTGVSLGQDAFIYYPTGQVPANAVSGSTRIGLIGGAYEANSGTGVTRVSNAAALSKSGAVAGYSTRYLNATNTTTNGQDAWYYDPARGITTATQIGLTGTNYELASTGNTNFRSSTITALGQNGMVGGTSLRFPTAATSTSNNGFDAWVYDAATALTYNVDPNTASTSGSLTSYVYSTIAYISDTGVALGYDYANSTSGTPSAPKMKLFDWYLGFDSLTGKNDIPQFSYLNVQVDPTSFSNWAGLYNTIGFAPSMTASGQIIGIGGLKSDNSNSYVPFALTVPEPSSLVSLAGVVLLWRRRRA